MLETHSTRALIKGQSGGDLWGVTKPIIQSRSSNTWYVTFQVNCDDREAVSNDGSWRRGVQEKGVECEAEDKTGDFCLPRHLVPKLGELHKSVGDDDVFIAGWCVTIPSEVLTVYALDEHPMNGIHNVGELVAIEIGVRRENLGIALVYILEDARGRVRDREVRNSVEKAQGGCCSKLLRPLCNHHHTITSIDTTNKGVETIHNNCGVKARGYHHQ